jgi:cell division protein FtsB
LLLRASQTAGYKSAAEIKLLARVIEDVNLWMDGMVKDREKLFAEIANLDDRLDRAERRIRELES